MLRRQIYDLNRRRSQCIFGRFVHVLAASLLIVLVSSPIPTSAQLPGICSPPSDVDGTLAYQQISAGGSSDLVEYLRRQGYTGKELENAAEADRLQVNEKLRSTTNALPLSLPPVKTGSLPLAGSLTAIDESFRSGAPHSVSASRLGATRYRPVSASIETNADDLLNDSTSESNDLLDGDSTRSSPSLDPLGSLGPDAAREQQREQRKQDSSSNTSKQWGIDPHAEVFANTLYPSALQCAKCHQKIFDEWRVSGHAYAAISPMFQRFEQVVSDLTRGTIGTFCTRCHAPVATQTNFPRHLPIFDGPHVLREGITCVACHRVVERYGRVNGERRIEPGSTLDPVVGNGGGDGVQQVIAQAEKFKVTVDPDDKRPRQAIHVGAIQFDQLSDSSYCAGCHQVVIQPGIALEIVYQQYRQGPAYKKGISCQDCHMGAVPGVALGYPTAACAEMSGLTLRTDRKHSNHTFFGPAYPIAHPGIFPHNEKALRWSAQQWLKFDWRSGWGTKEFEDAIARNRIPISFPSPWENAQERRDARVVIDSNLAAIALKRSTSLAILENGSRIEGPIFNSQPLRGQPLNFQYVVYNTSEGHNMPSGSLGAQPQLWLNAVLVGPNGDRVWESGDLDSNGDMRDQHSLDVRSRRIQPDLQLFNLQTKFLTTNLKGTDREMYLPINLDIDPLPFIRPGVVPYTVLNHPPFIRMEAHSIPPVDSKTASYSIPADRMQTPGIYRLSVRMRSRVEPVYFMRFVGGTNDMQRSMNEGIIDVHPYSTEFIVQ